MPLLTTCCGTGTFRLGRTKPWLTLSVSCSAVHFSGATSDFLSVVGGSQPFAKVAVRCNASLVAGNSRNLPYTVSKYIALHVALSQQTAVFLTAAIDREWALQSSTAGIVQLSLAYHEMKFNTLNIPQIYFIFK